MDRFIAAITAAYSWLGYIQLTRPSRKECEGRHRTDEARMNALCQKMSLMHEDIKKIETLMLQHITRGARG